MTGRRWTKLAIAGTLGLAVVGAGVTWFLKSGGRGKPDATRSAQAAHSPLKALAEGLRRGDAQALADICQRYLTKLDQPPPPPGEEEGEELAEVLDGLRGGFLKFSPPNRAYAVAASSHILDLFHPEPAPRAWSKALTPVGDLFLAGLADASPDVRSSALNELGRKWSWLPGRSMTPAEEEALAVWKDGFIAAAQRCLGDREPKSRAAAIVCLGALPIDAKAEPAVHYVDDPSSGGVRYKALMTFSNRPSLLTVDMVLKRLHDPELGIPELAEIILKARGLTKEQIYLGKQMTSPKPEHRVSVIPLLRERTDIDPVVWLIQLSHDPDDTVRAKAVEALIDRDSPEVDARLREVAHTDASPAIRAAAGKHVARSSPNETTAGLPPLPGSPGLNPKAN